MDGAAGASVNRPVGGVWVAHWLEVVVLVLPSLSLSLSLLLSPRPIPHVSIVSLTQSRKCVWVLELKLSRPSTNYTMFHCCWLKRRTDRPSSKFAVG